MLPQKRPLGAVFEESPVFKKRKVWENASYHLWSPQLLR